MLHTEVSVTNSCISNVNRQTDRRADGMGIAIALSQIGWLGARYGHGFQE